MLEEGVRIDHVRDLITPPQHDLVQNLKGLFGLKLKPIAGDPQSCDSDTVE